MVDDARVDGGGAGRSNGSGPDGPVHPGIAAEAVGIDEPLEPEEEAAGAAAADEPVDETLDERVAAVIAELDGVESSREGDGASFSVAGRPFAILVGGRLEAMLDPAVLRAALKTPDTASSSRGPGWIVFTPAAVDRFALDRAAAWVRSAHRRVAT